MLKKLYVVISFISFVNIHSIRFRYIKVHFTDNLMLNSFKTIPCGLDNKNICVRIITYSF